MSRFDEPHLEAVEYRLLRELFNEHCGIAFGPEAKPIIERRLRERVLSLGLASFGEYYQLLRFDERGRAELDQAIDLVTINETYFFRELYQLRGYRDEILPMLRQSAQPQSRLNVWSAGCSTGEEVYSIAMLTRESGLFPGRSIRVFGSDISSRCVAHARAGVYGHSAFRSTPPEMKRRYFIERPDGMHVIDELRSMCNFGRLNLLDSSRASVVGRVDVIFCRNVLIYFDDASRRRVIEMFYERLLPGGFLLLGHSESLLNVSTAFELVHLREDLVYRKPASSTRLSAALGRRPSAAPSPGSPRAAQPPGATSPLAASSHAASSHAASSHAASSHVASPFRARHAEPHGPSPALATPKSDPLPPLGGAGSGEKR